jgi:hypothetical protein
VEWADSKFLTTVVLGTPRNVILGAPRRGSHEFNSKNKNLGSEIQSRGFSFNKFALDVMFRQAQHDIEV